MSTLGLFRGLWPQYDSVADATVNVLITAVADEIGRAAGTWGRLYGQAICALVAHKLEIRDRMAASPASGGSAGGGVLMGAVTSVKTGDLAVGYASPNSGSGGGSGWTAGDALLAQTAGGQEYLRLRGRLATISVITV